MAMAARLLTRSKTLSIARLFRPSSLVGTAIPSSSSPCLRVLYYLASPPLLRPLHPCSIRPALYHTTPSLAPEGFGCMNKCPRATRSNWFLPRWLSRMAHGGTVTHLSKNIISQLCNSTEKNLLQTTCNGKEGDCSKVIAFSPLEGSHLKERKSGWGNESSKIKRRSFTRK